MPFCRRTFRLLEVASGLANKYGIPMDRIICGKGMPLSWKEKEELAGGKIEMSFLSDVVRKPAEELYKLSDTMAATSITATTDATTSHTPLQPKCIGTNTVPDVPLLLEEILIDVL